MRERFADQLASLTDDLAQMCQTVGLLIGVATEALHARDRATLETVITDCTRIDNRHSEIERRVLMILARQSPVGRDLRSTVSFLHIAADVGRMAGLARHICEIGCRRSQSHVRPLTAGDLVNAIGSQAQELAFAAAQVLIDADADGARRLAEADHTMDALCHRLIGDVEHHADGDVAIGVDLALLCRYYERFADHAVSISRRVHFLSTGRTVA